VRDLHPSADHLESCLAVERDLVSRLAADPATFRHGGGCEHRDVTDPAILRAILKVRGGAGGGYWVVECGTCEHLWQVPYFAAESEG
jgi:hypothetical protein